MVAGNSRLTSGALAEAFPAVWVKGEVSGFKRHGSGHLYFSLKDEGAVLGCVMWKGRAARLPVEPQDGLAVEAFGAVTVYEPQGRYQLVVDELRPAGLGARLLALEQLKQRLAAEGLFEEARKRPLPRYPARVGLVTSPSGAAVRDLVKVLRARWPGIGIVLAPVRVQGEGAAREIAEAIARFDRHAGVDLLIVGRGGGSLEDLWAFNEEPVVRAIAACRLPVVSAVGHEVDVTLADLAADVRVDDFVTVLRPLLESWAAGRGDGEGLGDYYQRVLGRSSRKQSVTGKEEPTSKTIRLPRRPPMLSMSIPAKSAAVVPMPVS